MIFALSSIPGLGTGLGTWDLVLRKLAHLVEFAILGALLARALPELYALLAGIAYAFVDEVHQSFVPGRTGALRDVAIDAVGVLLGILVWRRLTPRGASARGPDAPAPARSLSGLAGHGPRGHHVPEQGDGDQH